MAQPTIVILEVTLFDQEEQAAFVQHITQDGRVLAVKVLSA